MVTLLKCNYIFTKCILIMTIDHVAFKLRIQVLTEFSDSGDCLLKKLKSYCYNLKLIKEILRPELTWISLQSIGKNVFTAYTIHEMTYHPPHCYCRLQAYLQVSLSMLTLLLIDLKNMEYIEEIILLNLSAIMIIVKKGITLYLRNLMVFDISRILDLTESIAWHIKGQCTTSRFAEIRGLINWSLWQKNI